MLIENLATAIAQAEKTPGFYTDARARVVNLLEESEAGESPQLPEIEGETDIIPFGRVAFRGASLAGARVAVLAHWSEGGVPDAALRVYLQALKAEGYRVVVACGCEPQPAAWLNLAEMLVWRSCTGYDFASWKAAFALLPDLYDAQEVLCCNDSVFGPINPLGPVHRVMDAVPCDFWGLVESREKRRHLQSFYLVFRKKVLRHAAFKAFWQAVDTNPDKFATVLRYEMGLSPWLVGHGLAAGAYIPAACLPQTNVNPCHYFWRGLLERFEMPFIKRDLLRRAGSHPFLAGWEAVLAARGFDSTLCR